MGHPRISCLCISRGDSSRLKSAIECFCRQTWKDKELVLIVDDSEGARSWLPRYVSGMRDYEIRLFLIPALPIPSKLHLGVARNLAIDNATGDLCCQWDDDDLYHPDRLRVQAENLVNSGKEASYLGDQLHFFNDSKEFFWTRWQDPGIPGTLMHRRSAAIRYVENVSEAEYARKLLEDTILQGQLAKNERITVLRECYGLHTYVFHGANTWDRTHHDWCARNFSVSRESVLSGRSKVRRMLKDYFPDLGSTWLVCPDGLKMSLSPEGEDRAMDTSVQGRA